MNSQQKYNRIMEEMADKTLSFGCIIDDCWHPDYCKIIGHPLHIGDIYHWIENNEIHLYLRDTYDSIFDIWQDKRLSLSPTDEELVDYIYNLLQ